VSRLETKDTHPAFGPKDVVSPFPASIAPNCRGMERRGWILRSTVQEAAAAYFSLLSLETVEKM
jgi:hypothetical protein